VIYVDSSKLEGIFDAYKTRSTGIEDIEAIQELGGK
jgi:hypothetical protein